MPDKPQVKAKDISFNEAIVRIAAIHQRVVEFRYLKGMDSPIEVRRFTPTRVYTSADGKVLILGPDEDREEVRQYRLDRIRGDVKVP